MKRFLELNKSGWGLTSVAERQQQSGSSAVLSAHEAAEVRFWPRSAVGGWAEHVRSAQIVQTSTCFAIAKASSTSMPRYLSTSTGQRQITSPASVS